MRGRALRSVLFLLWFFDYTECVRGPLADKTYLKSEDIECPGAVEHKFVFRMYSNSCLYLETTLSAHSKGCTEASGDQLASFDVPEDYVRLTKEYAKVLNDVANVPAYCIAVRAKFDAHGKYSDDFLHRGEADPDTGTYGDWCDPANTEECKPTGKRLSVRYNTVKGTEKNTRDIVFCPNANGFEWQYAVEGEEYPHLCTTPLSDPNATRYSADEPENSDLKVALSVCIPIIILLILAINLVVCCRCNKCPYAKRRKAKRDATLAESATLARCSTAPSSSGVRNDKPPEQPPSSSAPKAAHKQSPYF